MADPTPGSANGGRQRTEAAAQTEGLGGGNPPIRQSADPNDGIWPYLGVGCVTFVSGLFGGGMIAVLIAKIVGAAQGCTPATETGAPCNWFTYAVFGAGAGMVLFPVVAVTLLRRGRSRQRNKV